MKGQFDNLISDAKDVPLNVGTLLLNVEFVKALIHEVEVKRELSRVLGEQMTCTDRLVLSILGVVSQEVEEIRRAN